MPGIKLYTSPLSYNGLRPEMVLAEKGIEDYDSIIVDLVKGEHKSPEMLAKAPWGKVPVLECPHAGPICESRSIARYLATFFADKGPNLLPDAKDLSALARFEEGLAIDSQRLDTDVSALFVQRTHAPLNGRPVDNAVVERSKKNIAATLKIVDGILEKQAYIGGDTFSLADINLCPEFLELVVTGEDEAIWSNPNVKRWWDEVSGRESWRKVSKPVWEAYEAIVAKVNGKNN